MKKYKLEDCPWCENNKALDIWERRNEDELLFYVICHLCEAQGPLMKSEEKAAEKWNEVMGMVQGFKENCIPSSYE